MRNYCKIFIRADIDEGELTEFVANQTGGRVFGPFNTHVETNWATMDVEFNEDSRLQHEASDEDAFLFYPIYVDIHPHKQVNHDEYVDRIGALLVNLWKTGFRAVASCDYEEELPRCGGYRPHRSGGTT